MDLEFLEPMDLAGLNRDQLLGEVINLITGTSFMMFGLLGVGDRLHLTSRHRRSGLHSVAFIPSCGIPLALLQQVV